MLNKLLLGMLALSISACIKVRDPKEEAKEESKKGQVAPQQVSEITYEIEPLPQFQKYLVRLKNLSGQTSVHRFSANSKDKPVVVGSLEDVVDHSGLVEYRILSNGQERFLRVEIPNDVLVEGEMPITKLPIEELKNSPLGVDKKVSIKGRLFFKSGSRLVTNGLRVLIEAQTIESEGASVYTRIDTKAAEVRFPNAVYKDGDSGGTIYLRAKVLRGALHFHLRGQDGSTGEQWSSKHYSVAQVDGFDGGNSGLLYVDIQDMSHGAITYNAEPGKGGAGVEIRSIHFGGGKSRVLRPKGKDGKSGIVQPPCLIKNGRCEELKAYN